MSYAIKISQDDNDRRLDRVLRGLFKHVTLGEIMKSIRLGEVRVNSKRVREPGTKIFAGDELVVKWDTTPPSGGGGGGHTTPITRGEKSKSSFKARMS